MAGYLQPILDQFQTVLQTNLNTEKDAIDSTLSDVNSDFIYKDLQFFPQDFPLVEIFPIGDSDIDADFTSTTMEMVWRIVTAITIQVDENEGGNTILDTYLTAMLKTLIKGTSQNWDLDDKVDLLRPVNISFIPDEAEAGTILKGGAIIWEAKREEDPTT